MNEKKPTCYLEHMCKCSEQISYLCCSFEQIRIHSYGLPTDLSLAFVYLTVWQFITVGFPSLDDDV
jgi:hypothetical protein